MAGAAANTAKARTDFLCMKEIQGRVGDAAVGGVNPGGWPPLRVGGPGTTGVDEDDCSEEEQPAENMTATINAPMITGAMILSLSSTTFPRS